VTMKNPWMRYIRVRKRASSRAKKIHRAAVCGVALSRYCWNLIFSVFRSRFAKLGPIELAVVVSAFGSAMSSKFVGEGGK
jgi:hypothetical protein